MYITFSDLTVNGTELYWVVDSKNNTASLYIPFASDQSTIEQIAIKIIRKLPPVSGIKIERQGLVISDFNQFCQDHKPESKSSLPPSAFKIQADLFEQLRVNPKLTRTGHFRLNPTRSMFEISTDATGTSQSARTIDLSRLARSSSTDKLKHDAIVRDKLTPRSKSQRDLSKPDSITADSSTSEPRKSVKSILSFNTLAGKNSLSQATMWRTTGVFKNEMLRQQELDNESIAALELLTPLMLHRLHLGEFLVRELHYQQLIARKLSYIINQYICTAAIGLSEEALTQLASIFRNQLKMALNKKYAELVIPYSDIEKDDLKLLGTFNPSSSRQIEEFRRRNLEELSSFMINTLWLNPDKEAIKENPALVLLRILRKNLAESGQLEDYLEDVRELQQHLIEFRETTQEIAPHKNEVIRQFNRNNFSAEGYVCLSQLIDTAKRNASKVNPETVLDAISKQLLPLKEQLDDTRSKLHNASDLNKEYLIKKDSSLCHALEVAADDLSKSKKIRNKHIIKAFTTIITKQLTPQRVEDSPKAGLSTTSLNI